MRAMAELRGRSLNGGEWRGGGRNRMYSLAQSTSPRATEKTVMRVRV